MAYRLTYAAYPTGYTPAASGRPGPGVRLFLPLHRDPLVQIPRRDLMLSAADSLELAVTVLETDRPDAPPIELSGGIGGPALSIAIWPDNYPSGRWDYGAPKVTPGVAIWSADGTVDPDLVGTFDLAMPPGTLASVPPRCSWSIVYSDQAGAIMHMLAFGALSIIPSGQKQTSSIAILTSDGDPILVPLLA